jgi:hypothetical protein
MGVFGDKVQGSICTWLNEQIDLLGGKNMSMRRENVMAFAVAASVLISLVPMRGGAQEPNANGLTGPTRSASDSSLSLEDLENRRQQIVVTSMNFSNDEQKRKFLQVYVPYQIKLKQILAGKRKLIEEYAQQQQNGVISSSDANRILKQALALDNRREEAVASYLRQLKPIEPEQQVLRAYQIRNPHLRDIHEQGNCIDSTGSLSFSIRAV